MKQPRNNTYQSGLAAEYLVVSCFIRLGLEAYITTGNYKKTDIRVVNALTNKTCSVDVKAVRGYSSVIVKNLQAQTGHFIVFVIFNDKIESPEVMPSIYIAPSEIVGEITTWFKDEPRVMKTKLEPFKSQWKLIQDFLL